MKWKPPPPDHYKINCDASYYQSTGKGGWGFVVRNEEGYVLQVGAVSLQYLSGPLHAEALAAMRSLKFAAQLGMSRVVLETDSLILGNALKSSIWDKSPNWSVFRQIRDMMLYEF
jgi:ribonuclease HI